MEAIKKNRYSSILLLSWSLLFVFLTPIVFLFIDENVEVTKAPIILHGDTVNYYIDNLVYYDNIIPTVTIDGWAFVETKQDNPEKYIKFLFVSDNVSYEIGTDLHDRPLQEFFKDKDVPIERNGFSTEFSPLIMKNGEYTLFINVLKMMKILDSSILVEYFENISDLLKNLNRANKWIIRNSRIHL